MLLAGGAITALSLGGTSVTIAGGASLSGSAANIGVPSGSSISFNGGSTVGGTIYADTGVTVSTSGGTVGGVVQPGSPMVEMVPVEDTLLIETRLKAYLVVAHGPARATA